MPDAGRTAALWVLHSLLKEDQNYLFVNSDEDVSYNLLVRVVVKLEIN